MNKLRILPGAAGIIALTATMGFVDGQRKIEAELYSRERAVVVRTYSEIGAGEGLSGDQTGTKPDISAYLVEIKRGDTTKKVLIDAANGKVLKS
jgi:hypothetical protein